jgi:hypothetical protein
MGNHLFPESNVSELLPDFASNKDDMLALCPCGGPRVIKNHAQTPLA